MMEKEDEEICSVCDKPFAERDKITVISGSTLRNYEKASVRRKDDKEEVFKNSIVLKVHHSCSRSYTSTRNIAAHLKKLNPKTASTSSNERQTRSSKMFDFENLCLFCEQDASVAYIKTIRKNKITDQKKNSTVCK